MSYPLAGVNGDVWTTSTPSITATNESCTDSGDHTLYTASAHTFWDWTQTFTVQCSPNGSSSWATVTDYTVRWSLGQIVFTTARSVGVNNFVRISTGNYFAASQLDASFKWNIALKAGTKDTTVFQSSGAWQTNTAVLKSASGKIMTYRNDDRLALELGNLLGLQLFVDKTNNVRWQLFGVIREVSPESDVNGIQQQSISFQSVRDTYFLAS